MVRAPICEVCQRSDYLCPVDEEKLKKGEISELDVRISRILYDLDSKYRIGDTVEFVRAYDMNSFVLILVRGEIGRLIGKNGKVLRAFRQAVGKPVRIVEIDVDLRKTIQDLFGGVRVIGINKLFRPDGVVYRIVVARKDVRKLSFPYPDVQKALDILLDQPHEVTFI
ncbi:MAG: transcription elongation factor NusA [Candidatus Diapherotrites archaeon]|nr:transcription elongation factor NusA [Candidatus Diapherotrites archaeon]